MKSAFSVIIGVWLVAGGLRFLLGSHLPQNLRARWICIASAISCFVVSGAVLGPDAGLVTHVVYAAAIGMGFVAARAVSLRPPGHVPNLLIFVTLLVPALFYVYGSLRIHSAFCYFAAATVGVFVFQAFRSGSNARIELGPKS